MGLHKAGSKINPLGLALEPLESRFLTCFPICTSYLKDLCALHSEVAGVDLDECGLLLLVISELEMKNLGHSENNIFNKHFQGANSELNSLYFPRKTP